MKKLILFIVFVFFFTACDKGKKVEPDPPPVAKKAEVTVKFGPLPEDCSSFGVSAVSFCDADTIFFTYELKYSHYKYPKFTYKLNEEQVEKYLGKKVYLYFRACRNLGPSDCWVMEVYLPINPLKEGNNEVYVNIPGRDVLYK